MPTSPSDSWGDPTAAQFKSRNIRESRVDGSIAHVNLKIVAAVTRLLETLSQAGVKLPTRIPSYDPAGSEYQRLGLALRIDAPFDAELAAAVARWGFVGVQVDTEPLPEFRFTGTPEEASILNDEAIATHLDDIESEDVSGPTPHKWPGRRPIRLGDVGADVAFLQLLFGCHRTDGHADEELMNAALQFQRRRGAPPAEQGILDARFWSRVIPKRMPTVYGSDTGWNVRMLQAAMAAQGFTSTKVTGLFGVLTVRDLRALQKDHHLRVAPYARGPEWSLLFGPDPWGNMTTEIIDERDTAA